MEELPSGIHETFGEADGLSTRWQREPYTISMNRPLTPSLSPDGGEGGRRSGEGMVHGPDAYAKAKGGFP